MEKVVSKIDKQELVRLLRMSGFVVSGTSYEMVADKIIELHSKSLLKLTSDDLMDIAINKIPYLF